MPLKPTNKIYTIEHPHFGVVHVCETGRVKRLSIKIVPSKGILLTFNPRSSLQTAIAFLESKREWVDEKMAKAKKLESTITQFQLYTPFSLGHLNLTIVPTLNRMFTVSRIDNFIELRLPKGWEPGNELTDTKIRHRIEQILIDEASRTLPVLLKKLAEKHGISYNHVKISKARSYWGLCTHTNDITLNAHIIRLPAHLQVYVLLHELTHCIHKNHGSAFWNQLSVYMNTNAKKVAAELKIFRINIF